MAGNSRTARNAARIRCMGSLVSGALPGSRRSAWHALALISTRWSRVRTWTRECVSWPTDSLGFAVQPPKAQGYSHRLSCPALASPVAHALATHALRTLATIAPRVLLIERMALLAVRLARTSGIAAPRVLARRHWFKVLRIHAVPNAAKVIDFEFVWYRASDDRERNSMRMHDDRLVSEHRIRDGKPSVALRRSVAGPKPTAFSLCDVLPEQFDLCVREDDWHALHRASFLRTKLESESPSAAASASRRARNGAGMRMRRYEHRLRSFDTRGRPRGFDLGIRRF